MGHYASEMDPDFGKPTYGERIRALHRQNAIDGLTALIVEASVSRSAHYALDCENLEVTIKPRIEHVVDSIIHAVDTR